MKSLTGRLKTLEQATRQTVRRAYIWVRPGQSYADALAKSGYPDDGNNEFFTWRDAQ